MRSVMTRAMQESDQSREAEMWCGMGTRDTFSCAVCQRETKRLVSSSAIFVFARSFRFFGQGSSIEGILALEEVI